MAQSRDGTNDIGALVHHDRSRGTKTRLTILQAVEVHDLVITDALGQDGCRGSTRNDGLEIVPASTDTSTVFVDELPEGDAHLLLDCAGVVDMARNTEELGALVALSTEAGEP